MDILGYLLFVCLLQWLYSKQLIATIVSLKNDRVNKFSANVLINN